MYAVLKKKKILCIFVNLGIFAMYMVLIELGFMNVV